MKLTPISFAGVEGIEPSVRVLETRGLPLTDTPIFLLPEVKRSGYYMLQTALEQSSRFPYT